MNTKKAAATNASTNTNIDSSTKTKTNTDNSTNTHTSTNTTTSENTTTTNKNADAKANVNGSGTSSKSSTLTKITSITTENIIPKTRITSPTRSQRGVKSNTSKAHGEIKIVDTNFQMPASISIPISTPNNVTPAVNMVGVNRKHNISSNSFMGSSNNSRSHGHYNTHHTGLKFDNLTDELSYLKARSAEIQNIMKSQNLQTYNYSSSSISSDVIDPSLFGNSSNNSSEVSDSNDQKKLNQINDFYITNSSMDESFYSKGLFDLNSFIKKDPVQLIFYKNVLKSESDKLNKKYIKNSVKFDKLKRTEIFFKTENPGLLNVINNTISILPKNSETWKLINHFFTTINPIFKIFVNDDIFKKIIPESDNTNLEFFTDLPNLEKIINFTYLLLVLRISFLSIKHSRVTPNDDPSLLNISIYSEVTSVIHVLINYLEVFEISIKNKIRLSLTKNFLIRIEELNNNEFLRFPIELIYQFNLNSNSNSIENESLIEFFNFEYFNYNFNIGLPILINDDKNNFNKFLYKNFNKIFNNFSIVEIEEILKNFEILGENNFNINNINNVKNSSPIINSINELNLMNFKLNNLIYFLIYFEKLSDKKNYLIYLESLINHIYRIFDYLINNLFTSTSLNGLEFLIYPIINMIIEKIFEFFINFQIKFFPIKQIFIKLFTFNKRLNLNKYFRVWKIENRVKIFLNLNYNDEINFKINEFEFEKVKFAFTRLSNLFNYNDSVDDKKIDTFFDNRFFIL